MSLQSAPPTTIPTSLWVLAWASLAGQVWTAVQQGLRSDDAVPIAISMVLGALVVGYVSVGVVRARPARTVLAFVVLGLVAVFEVVGVALSDSVGSALATVVALAITATQLTALARFRGTEWWAWQRGRPPTSDGPRITGVVAIAVAVGVLGGLIANPVEVGPRFQVAVAQR